MPKFIHAIIVSAVLIEADEIFSVNAVDKKGYAGEYHITYPDGKQAIVSAELFEQEFHELKELTEEEEARLFPKEETPVVELPEVAGAAEVISLEEKPSTNGVEHKEEPKAE